MDMSSGGELRPVASTKGHRRAVVLLWIAFLIGFVGAGISFLAAGAMFLLVATWGPLTAESEEEPGSLVLTHFGLVLVAIAGLVGAVLLNPKIGLCACPAGACRSPKLVGGAALMLLGFVGWALYGAVWFELGLDSTWWGLVFAFFGLPAVLAVVAYFDSRGQASAA